MIDSLKLFIEADWNSLNAKLAKYALFQINKSIWRNVEGAPGKSPKDLVLDAVEKTYHGLVSSDTGKGIRKWDPARCPLITFLKGVIDSDVDDLSKRKVDKASIYSENGALRDDFDALIHASGINAGGEFIDGEQKLIHKQEQEQIKKCYETKMKELYKLCEDDDEETLVLMAYEELTKKDDDLSTENFSIATGLEGNRLRSARRRVEYKIDKMAKQAERKRVYV